MMRRGGCDQFSSGQGGIPHPVECGSIVVDQTVL